MVLDGVFQKNLRGSQGIIQQNTKKKLIQNPMYFIVSRVQNILDLTFLKLWFLFVLLLFLKNRLKNCANERIKNGIIADFNIIYLIFVNNYIKFNNQDKLIHCLQFSFALRCCNFQLDKVWCILMP